MAVDPIKITIKDKQVEYVTAYNYTNEDYIIALRISSEKGESVPFAINPPVRLLKKNDSAKIGIIYLGWTHKQEEKKYLLSISFLNYKKESAQKHNLSIPLTIVHQIPVIID